MLPVSKKRELDPLFPSHAQSIGRKKLAARARLYASLGIAGMTMATTVISNAKTINFMEANNGAASVAGGGFYDDLYYGQGAASDPGNNVWNGFGNQAGPGSTYFYGPALPDSTPSGNPGNPYASYGSGTSPTVTGGAGSTLFSPASYTAPNPGNAYSDGTLSPITFKATYTGENGGTSSTNQGQPKFITSMAALVNGGAVGTYTLGGVPTGTYDLYLYGANTDNTRGATFTASSGNALNGLSSTINSNTGGQVNNFTLGQDYVEFTGVMPDSSGNISGTFSAVSNNLSGLSGEGDFNGLQLVSVAASPTFIYTGYTNGSFDTSTPNFYNSTDSTKTPIAFTTADGNDIAVFDDTATGTHDILVTSGGVSPSEIIFNNSTSNYNFSSGGGPISGTGYVTMNGTGTVTLSNSNSYTGPTNINAGTLVIGATGTLASSPITIASGGTLTVASGGLLTSSTLTLNDNGTVNFGSSVTVPTLNGTGVVNLMGTGTNLTLVNGGTFSGTLNGSGSILTLSGTGGNFGGAFLAGASPNSEVFNSTGTWNVSGVSTYTGGTTLTAGVAKASNNSAFGSGPIILNGGSISSSAPVTFSNLVTGGALTVAAGSNVIDLTNTSNSFTGPITVNGGTLKIDSLAAQGPSTSVVVNSGGSYEPNDTATFGKGYTVTITGPGMTSTLGAPTVNGPTGALRGVDQATTTWAGNVIVSGGAYIVPGADGTLVLSGAISGTGPVTFTGNPDDQSGGTTILAPAAGVSNTYTGETVLLPTLNINVYPTGTVLQLGADNGVSPSSGLNVSTGNLATAVYETFDLAGYNQSVQYLTGQVPPSNTTQITNSGGSLSTLTISSGLKNGQPAIAGTPIDGNIAVVMNDPTGAGTQILNGSSAYTGGTTITSGKLTAASPNAFGTLPVKLNGGTLGLGLIQTPNPTPLVTGSSFSSFQLNSGNGSSPATVNGTTLQLTTAGVANTSNSAFYKSPVTVSDAAGFTAQFQFQAKGGYADGVAFVLQNDPRGASAVPTAAGGSLGYGSTGGITNSAAVLLNIYNFNPAGGLGTAFATNGTLPSSYIDTAPVNGTLFYSNGGYYYSDSQLIDVTLVYDGVDKTLTETLYGETVEKSFQTTYTGIDYSSILSNMPNGSTTAYIGFTGATGGANATQTIGNFSYTLNNSTPQSISNSIVANAGTTSAIQIQESTLSTTTFGGTGPVTINGNATVNITNSNAGARGVFVPQSLSIASTGKLDLGSNDLDLTSGTGETLAQVTALIKTGFNGGSWNGSGIASSAAAADPRHLTALGVIVNNGEFGAGGTFPTFDGSIPANGDILVKYTYYGDANLDGAVDGSDYTLIDAGFGSGGTLTGWYNGDFNYDGKIDGSDYTLIDNAFNTQGASLGSNPAALVASSTAQIAGGASVPEPATLSLLGMGAAGLLAKRRRRN
jgi:fibronectin-binding autotransporter adhesin